MDQRRHSRSKQKKELYKLAAARSDFMSARKSCKIILERVSGLGDELYAPLFHAAIMAYARPFVDNKSTGVLSRHWSEFTDERFRKTHKDLIKTRHEIVAHTDSSVRSIMIIPPGYKPVAGLPASEHLGLIINSYYYPRQRFIDCFDTCSNLIGRLNHRLDELLSQLYEHQELPLEPFPLVFDDGL